MTYALHLAVMLGLYGMLALAANLAIGFGVRRPACLSPLRFPRPLPASRRSEDSSPS